MCLNCNANCKTCSVSSTKCLTCNDGNYLDTVTSTCKLCYATCKTCTLATANDCTGCVDGYYLSVSSCSLCNALCVTCDGATTTSCLSCH